MFTLFSNIKVFFINKTLKNVVSCVDNHENTQHYLQKFKVCWAIEWWRSVHIEEEIKKISFLIIDSIKIRRVFTAIYIMGVSSYKWTYAYISDEETEKWRAVRFKGLFRKKNICMGMCVFRVFWNFSGISLTTMEKWNRM